MKSIANELIMLVACAVFVAIPLLQTNAIIGFLASITLIGICGTSKPCMRYAAEGLFCIVCCITPLLLVYIPVCVCFSFKERVWPLRFIWFIPLIAALLTTAVPLSVWLQITLLGTMGIVLTVLSKRDTASYTGLRFAYDDMRERYLAALRNPTPQTEHETHLIEDHFSDLTERELMIVQLVAEGFDNKDIAAELYLSEGTVRNHISAILARKGLSNRTQLAVMFLRNNG